MRHSVYFQELPSLPPCSGGFSPLLWYRSTQTFILFPNFDQKVKKKYFKEGVSTFCDGKMFNKGATEKNILPPLHWNYLSLSRVHYFTCSSSVNWLADLDSKNYEIIHHIFTVWEIVRFKICNIFPCLTTQEEKICQKTENLFNFSLTVHYVLFRLIRT